jgi:hypothetical protein
MDTKEIASVWEWEETNDGAHATREWVCDWSNLATLRKQYATIGKAYYAGSNLYCTSVRVRGEGKPDGYDTTLSMPKFTQARVTAEFATYQKLDSAPITTWEVSAEVLELGLGRRWCYAGTICDQAQSMLMPQAELTLQMTLRTLPRANLIAMIGKINGNPFQGFSVGTLLFLGANTEARYDYERKSYIYNVAYKFLFKPQGHNTVWRAPRQARDSSGALLWWDDDEQDPIFVTGLAGTAGWDRPHPHLYDYVDFNPLIGLPAMPITVIEPMCEAAL